MEETGTDVEVRQTTALDESSRADATERIQAALVIAKKFPRDTTRIVSRIKEACKRITLAESALYAYPRGRQLVTGPSIRLAEALAQMWGNIDFGIVELSSNPGYEGSSVVESFCWDLETNVKQRKIFAVPHKIHLKGGKAKHLTDPRDIYELVANYGARRLRKCILGIIPGDIVDMAVKECEHTIAKGGGEPLIDRINKMVVAFADVGVSQDMLENRLGHAVKLTTEAEIMGLKTIFTSLKDGQSKREDWFDFGSPEGGKADEVNKRIRGANEKESEDKNHKESTEEWKNEE